MKKFRSALLLGSAALFVAVPSTAQLRLQIDQVEKSIRTLNVLDVDPAKGPRRGGLAELKWREGRGEWATCRALAERLLPSSKDLEPWVQRTRLECALQEFQTTKKTAALSRSFVATKSSFFRKGPWASSLTESWAKAGLQLATVQPVAGRERTLQTLMNDSDLLTREQKSQIYQLWSEVHESKNPRQALHFLRQAASIQLTPAIDSKINSLETKLASAPKGAGPAEDLVFGADLAEGAEIETDREIAKFLAEGKNVEAAKAMVDLLNRFPNGLYSRRDRERVPQLLLAAVDRGDESEASRLRAVMSEADSARLSDWISLLHRRGEDLGTVVLAEKMLSANSSSPQLSAALWAGGRSAQFRGDNEKAKRFFDRLIQYHGQTEESAEALFRLGLMQLREGLHATSAKTFDKLIARKIPRWDLNARYWRIRGMQQIPEEKARLELEQAELQRLYPFTYYGLLLKAESAEGIVEFPKNDRSPLETLKPETWLVGDQRAAWNRFLKLSAEGWLWEAQQELALIPAPTEAWSLFQWAKVLAKANQFQSSILLVSRAMESDESLRHPRYLEFVFPKAYGRFIDAEAAKRQLDPALVRSLIRQESAFNSRAVSSANALGLMQMIPPTAREVAQELKLNVNIPNDLFRPEINVPMGSYYIAKMIRQYQGHIPMALAAYNAGPGRFGRWMRARPDGAQLLSKTPESWKDEMWYDELPWSETSFYVKAILRNVLLDRLTAEGRVAVNPQFWSNLRVESARIDKEKLNQR